MGKAIYGVYFIVAIGAGAFALQFLTANQSVSVKVMECSRLHGAELEKCMKQAEEMAKPNAVIAKAVAAELEK
jgi:hypothetical protein